jgi:aminodeoxyfutalosine deaminase
MILRARVILPVAAPPIEDGAIVVAGHKIVSVGRWPDLSRRAPRITRHQLVDLGDVIVLPGLINAHCHLDYTDMAGMLPPPRTFTDWIGAITALKGAWSYTEFAESWLHGAHQLLKTGTTTVADFESVPELLPEVWESTPLRVFSFLELTGVRSRRRPALILSDAVAKIESLKNHPRNRAWLAPHAPYSTVPELLQRTARVAQKRNWPVSTHVAESPAEFEMFQHARGAMHEWLGRNQRDNSDCGLGSPVAHLARNKLLGENVLAVHVNCLARGDATLLAKNKTSVVHCPRSHDYFNHPPFQLSRLAAAGVNICLGTDSLATVRKNGRQKPELNMFAEMRALANREKNLTPLEILKMATIAGARALGMAGKTGELSPNALADLIAIPFTGKPPGVAESVMENTDRVAVSMVAGRWAIPLK